MQHLDDSAPFGGYTYSPEHDLKRLTTLLYRVKALMSDQRWRTLGEIVAITGGSEASVSARLRDMRKFVYGAHEVERRARGERSRGLFEYRLRLMPVQEKLL